MQIHYPLNPTTGAEDQTQLPWSNGVPQTGQEGSYPPYQAVVEPMQELVNLITLAGLTPSDTDLDQVTRAVRGGQLDFDATETGSADAMAVQIGLPHTKIQAGLPFSFVKGPNANTGNAVPTLTITDLQGNNGLTGTIVKAGGGAVAKGDLPGGALITLRAVAPNVFALVSLVAPSDVVSTINITYAKGSLIAKRVFTSSGTYTPTPGTNKVRVTLVGGGGGGGSTAATGSTQWAAAGGGGGGGVAIGTYMSGFSSVAMTIGAGGPFTPTAGAAGGTTSFGSLLSATGGTGGSGGGNVATAAVQSGGSGGGGSGGTETNGVGSAGGISVSFSQNNLASGFGGASYFGFGASAVFTSTSGGVNATSYGAGGSGAVAQGSAAAQPGGAGGSGLIIVEEYA